MALVVILHSSSAFVRSTSANNSTKLSTQTVCASDKNAMMRVCGYEAKALQCQNCLHHM